MQSDKSGLVCIAICVAMLALFIWGCSGCISSIREEAEAREKVRQEYLQHCNEVVKAAIGKKVKSITHEHRTVTITFEDGSTVIVRSIAHHSAGSHVEIGGSMK